MLMKVAHVFQNAFLLELVGVFYIEGIILFQRNHFPVCFQSRHALLFQ